MANEADAVALYHVVYADEDFDAAAHAVHRLIYEAQEQQPGQRRLLYLDIEGHRNAAGGYDAAMLELQQNFILGYLLPYLAEAHLPLVQIRNPAPQREDLPETLSIQPAPRERS
jgi:hypothetical protein